MESSIVSRHRHVDGVLRAKSPHVTLLEERFVRDGHRRDTVHEQPGQEKQSQVKINAPVDVCECHVVSVRS